MNDNERQCLDTILNRHPARMADGMEAAFGSDQLLGDNHDHLALVGSAWIEGYVAAHLAMLRGMHASDPALSAEDVSAIETLVLRHEDEIVSQLTDRLGRERERETPL